MKILNLKLKEHPILGNLELDFTNKNNEPAKSIIIAGDNGTGKTTLLKLLLFYEKEYEILFLKIIFTIKFSDFELELIKNKINYKNINISNILNVTWHQIEGSPIYCWHIELNNNYIEFSFFQQFFKNIYLNTEDIIKNRNMNDINNNEKMLINLSIQDSLESTEKLRDYNNKNNIILEDILDIRMTNFKKAFNDFFQLNNLKFEKVEHYLNGDSKIFFKKNNKEFDTSNFSKGEYLIFSTSCEILKRKLEEESIILIDEPENGLHPEWQLNLLPHYKKISENKQLIFSTHSPFIINSVDEDDKIIILKRKDDNEIDSTSVQYYGLPEIEKISYKMNIIPDPNKLKLIVAGKTDEIYLNHVIKLFKNQDNIFDNIEIIYPFDDDNGGYGGDNSLIILNKSHNSMYETNLVLFIYDWDLKEKQKIKILSLKNQYLFKIEGNKNYKDQENAKLKKLKGIENFLPIKESFYKNKMFFNGKIDKNSNEDEFYFKKGSKLEFCYYLIENLEKEDFILLKNQLLEAIQQSKFKVK